MHRATMLLHPRIHTAQLIRNCSPFLTAVLAYIVAPFLPHVAPLRYTLCVHTMLLSNQCFSMGYRSFEVIQAYCLLA